MERAMIYRKPVLVGLPMVLVPLTSGLMTMIPMELRLYVLFLTPVLSAIICYGVTFLIEDGDFDHVIVGVGIYGLAFVVVGMLVWPQVDPASLPATPSTRWMFAVVLTISGLLSAVLCLCLAMFQQLHEIWKRRGKATTTE